MVALRRIALALAAGATIALTPPPAVAQPAGEADTPPAIQLGRRLLGVWTRLPAAPTLVIVSDEESYLRALEHWELGAMWPVLIDDGSDDARENIARFVRAYAPTQVVRWSAPDLHDPDFNSLSHRVDAMVAHAWGAPSADALDARWNELAFVPPGVVVTSEDDPAWVAGAALAAGHGQPIIWVAPPPGKPSQLMKAPDLESLDRAITAGLRAEPWPWESLGDAIDAVTLCLNAPGRIPAPADAKGDFALTDRIGRHPDDRRYAWCDMIIGNQSEAAYCAMCALFLAPDSGWVFDGYDDGYPAQFAAQNSLPLFERRGFPVVFTAPEGATLDVWRARCRGAIDGGFVHVNSAGYPTWFQLARKERAYASETPLLKEPAIVHFIHSFSARGADNPATISGRWLENGAYAYVGAVHEPTLGGFVSAEMYFGRLFSGIPFGAASRYDNAPPWKIQTFGDPLIIAGPPRPRRDVEPPLEGATPLEATMKDALRDRHFAEAVTILVQLGRDEDALRLARSALEQADDADRTTIARAAIYPAFRASDTPLFIDLYELLPAETASDESHRAMLWQLLRPLALAGDPDPRVVSLLRRHIRNDSALEDATDLRPAMLDLYGKDSVDAMFLELIERTKNEKAKAKLRDAMGPG